MREHNTKEQEWWSIYTRKNLRRRRNEKKNKRKKEKMNKRGKYKMKAVRKYKISK